MLSKFGQHEDGVGSFLVPDDNGNVIRKSDKTGYKGQSRSYMVILTRFLQLTETGGVFRENSAIFSGDTSVVKHMLGKWEEQGEIRAVAIRAEYTLSEIAADPRLTHVFEQKRKFKPKMVPSLEDENELVHATYNGVEGYVYKELYHLREGQSFSDELASSLTKILTGDDVSLQRLAKANKDVEEANAEAAAKMQEYLKRDKAARDKREAEIIAKQKAQTEVPF